MMDRIEIALQLIRHGEGYRDKPYQDSLGFWTIGFGRCYQQFILTDTEINFIKEHFNLTINDRTDTSKVTELFSTMTSKEIEKFAFYSLRFIVATLDYKLQAICDFYNGMTNEKKAAMLDMSYNLGSSWTNPNSSRYWPVANRYLRLEDFSCAADAMLDSKWKTQVGFKNAKEFPPYGQRAFYITEIIRKNILPGFVKETFV